MPHIHGFDICPSHKTCRRLIFRAILDSLNSLLFDISYLIMEFRKATIYKILLSTLYIKLKVTQWEAFGVCRCSHYTHALRAC